MPRLFRSCALRPRCSLLALIPAAAPAPRPADPASSASRSAPQAIEAFDPREPARTRFGALTFRGGLVLESPHRDFGGLSALHVAPDGEHFLSLTDKGYWLRGRIVYRDGRPIAIADAEMAPILGPDGRPLNRRGWYDTEALAEDGGTLYVGIERVNQIVRFDYAKDGLRARGQPIAVPPAIKTLPHNKSSSAWRCRIAAKGAPLAGTLIAISERGLDARGNLLGFLIGRTGGTFTLKRTDDFDVSDCAITPRGDLLVLERRFSWVRGRRHAHPQRAARRDQARRAGRRAGADLRRHGPSDRQHGGPVGASRGRRRARADADLRRQFFAAAAHAAAAVHAGGRSDGGDGSARRGLLLDDLRA